MENSYVYEEEQYEEGITFKKIGYFFKKAWIRMIIYAVIAALLATAIAVPIKVYYRSEPVAETSVEFIYDGIEKGLAPNGAIFNSDNIISTTVLSKAVEEAKLGGVIKDITSLRDRMRVEGVPTDEYQKLVEAAANGDKSAQEKLRKYTMYPTRFDIVISDPEQLGLSDDQAVLLLNKVVTEYYNDFKQRYAVTEMFANDMYDFSQNATVEFTDAYDLYIASLETVKDYLERLSQGNAAFVSTENSTSFAQLLSDLNILIKNYDLFNASVLSGNIWRNKTAAKNSLTASSTDIDNKRTALQEYITELKDQISNIKPTTVTTVDSNGQATTITSYPEEYYTYQKLLNESNLQVLEYNTQKKNIETRLKALEDTAPTDQASIDRAQTELKSLEQYTVDFIDKVNSTIEDYYNAAFISSSVRQVRPPVVTRRSLDFNLLLVYAVALIAAMMIAGIVTGVKISKASNAKKNCAASEETTAIVDTDNENKEKNVKE